MHWYLKIFLLISLQLMMAAPAVADEGKDLYEKQCSGCHTIGGGDSGGPDLKGVTGKRSAAWLERVITEPDKLTAEKDPVQLELVKKYGYEMPNLGLSREDAGKLIAHLAGGAPSSAGTPAEQAPAKKEGVTVTPQLIAEGKALFIGRKQFSKGGAPCVACHAFTYPGITGANLAADLTDLYAKMGEQGVRGVLKSLKFPIMKKAYADRPLTDEEINALIAFTKDAAENKGRGFAAFPLAGAGLFVCFIVGLSIYKRRIG